MAIKDVTRTVTAGRKPGVVLASGSGTSNGSCRSASASSRPIPRSRCGPAVWMKRGFQDYARAHDRRRRFPACGRFRVGRRVPAGGWFHRVAAAEVAGLAELPARVLQGGPARRCSTRSVRMRITVWTAHLRTKIAVRAMLDDPEWGVWSDSEIARRCRVSQPFVGKVRHCGT